MQCPNCGGQIADNAKFCTLCGRPVNILKETARFCPNCGSKLAPDAFFCNGCGQKVQNAQASAQPNIDETLPKEQQKPIASSTDASATNFFSTQMGSGEQEIDLAEVWNTLLSIVFKIPDLKIDREKFLREKLAPLCYKNDVEAAIAGNPTEVINPQIIAKVANKCVEEKQAKMSGSLIIKLVNFAISKTAIGPVLDVLGYLGIKIEPADFGAYYYFEVKLLQELAYLYGFPEMFDNSGKPLANTIDVLTICIAVTADESVAKDKLKQYLKKNETESQNEQNDIKLDINVLKRILPSLVMVSKDNFTSNSKILQNYLHAIYFGGIPEKNASESMSNLFQEEQESSRSNFIVGFLDFFGFILSFPWGGISFKKFKKRPVWRRAINWLYAVFLCCAIAAFVTEYTKPSLPQYESITDVRDGHTYKAMTIDGKKWIMENIQYDVPGSICENCKENGRLYSFTDALDACPEGFGLPSKEEYQSLEQIIKNNKGFIHSLYEFFGIDSVAFGKSLKSKTSWNGLDIIGFNAIPTGFYSFSDSVVKRSSETTGFWTSDLTTKGIVRMKIENNDDTVSFGSLNRNYGFSVRCIEKNMSKDEFDSILIKITQQDLNTNKKAFDWPTESVFKKMKKNVKYSVLENGIWNIYKEKKTNECIVFTAMLKKDIGGCKIGSSIEVYSVRHNNKMSYLANTDLSEENFCPWILNSVDSNTFGNDAEFEWSEWGDYMLNIYASCGIQLSEFEEDEL